jgi:octaprenyl-diphosphate synthase
MSLIGEIRKPVETEIKGFESHFRSSMKSKIPLVNIITNYLLRHKGKQIRPLFVFLTAKMIGTVNSSTFTAASLIELLHTASLIHDDVVDDANERRGYFSINALWKSKVAVLLGDYLLAQGLLLAVRENEYELLRIVSDAVREMSEGELLQIQRSRSLSISQIDYFDIIRKKTATLIAACTACGARSVNAGTDVIEKLRLFGENIGIAFQIKDDLFDYQKHGIIGKPTGNDLKEKKFTLPLIYALENSSGNERNRIIGLIRKQNHNHQKINDVIDFTIRNNGLRYAEQKMLEYKDQAIELISEYPMNEAKESLIKLVNFTIERKN